MTEFQASEQRRRHELLTQFIALKNEGLSGNKASARLNESHATLCRWEKRFRELGLDGLVPRQAIACGDKPKFDLTETEQNALRHWRLRKGSLPLAIEFFKDDPDCRPETRAKIQEEMDLAARQRRIPRWPLSIQRAGYVSDDEKALHRGPKHFQEFEIVERRGMWLIGANGHEIPLVGNTLFESDDMSLNEPFRYSECEWRNGDPVSVPRLGRQMLATMDVYSATWLGTSPVGRERDAYRLEDIADHLLDVVDAHGLPMFWRFERGPWENQVIDGIEVGGQGSDVRWGGLEHLFRVAHVFKSRSKGLIETSFSLLQSLTAHESLTIGRNRGEFERATKLFLAAGRGDASAASHFWEIGEAADGTAAAMRRFNERPKIRRAFGKQATVPFDLLNGAEKRPCPASERWRFSPIKRAATVRGGAIEVSVNHYPFPFRFRVNGCEPHGHYLERGYSVLIAFHPGRPEDGCHVFNAELGSRNRENLKLGEFLMVAPFAEDAPQLNLRPSEYAFAARKNANAAVRSEFRAITCSHGRAGRRVSTARDGFGNSVRREGVTIGANNSRAAVASRCGSRGDPVSPAAGEDSPAVGHESEGAPKFQRSDVRGRKSEEDDLATAERLEREFAEREGILPSS